MRKLANEIVELELIHQKSIDEEERKMGITQVKETISRIIYIREKEQEIKDALNTRLLPVDPAPSNLI